MNDQVDKKPRPRSPEFPYISLREAITRVEQLFKAYTRHAARIKNLAQVWNFSAGSSSLLRNVAALKSYGLIDETGSGEERKIAISDLGMRMVADKRPGVHEAAMAIAFNNCTILKEYQHKWGEKRPPDHECISELTLDNGFTEVAAKKFISVYDDSVGYSQRVQPDSPDGDATPEVDKGEPPKVDPAEAVTPGVTKPPKAVGGGGEMVEATYPIAEGACTLSFPKQLSVKSAKKLKRWLELMIDDVAEAGEDAAEKEE